MKLNISEYQKKLIIFGLLIGTIPAILLGVFSYNKSSNIIQKKVNETNLQVLLQTEMRVEEMLKSIQYYYSVMANSYTISDSLNKHLTHIDYDTVVNIQRSMLGIQAAQASVKSAWYANLNNDWVISNEGMSALNNKFNMDELNKTIKNNKNSFWICSRSDAALFIKAETDSSGKVITYKPEDNINLIIKLPLNSNEPQGVFVINLQGNEFLKSAVQDDRADEMLILDSNYNMILKDGNNIIDEKNMGTFISGLKDKKNLLGIYSSKLSNSNIGVTYRKSSYNDWIYVSVYKTAEITKDSRSIAVVTIVLCSLIVILVLGVSIFGSSVMYTPIRNIYDTIVTNTDQQEEAGHRDEISYIGEGINTLFTKQTEMSEQIKNHMFQIEELFLIKLVSGKIDSNEIEIKLAALGYTTGACKWTSLLSIQIDTFENTKYSENDRELLMFSINNITCELVEERNRFKPAVINEVLVLLIRGEQQNYEDFKQFVYKSSDDIQQNVSKYLRLSISIGISRTFHDLVDTQIAYKESIEALMCSIRFGEKTILYYEDVQPNGYIKQPYPKNIEDEMINAINHGESEKATELLDQLVNEIVNNELSLSEYQVCLTRLLINIIGILQDSGESVNILFVRRDQLFTELYKLRNSDQIKKWFRDSIINPVCKCLEERRGSQHKHILDEVINMIHTEYDKDISLEICASRLNYHPSYIWRVLKKEMDTTFSEYLSNYRLSMARQLLEETAMSVGEIAEKLGYNNSQNFIRYFKKQRGVTPGQYRESFHNNSNK